MTKFVKINDAGVIDHVSFADPGDDGYVSAPDNVAPDWIWNGVAFVPPAPSLAYLRLARLDLLRTACAATILSGFVSYALGAPHAYPSDETSQRNLNGSITESLLSGLPEGWTTPFWCADATGTWVFAPHSAAQIQQVGRDCTAMIRAAQTKLKDLRAAVEAAATVDQINSITW